MTKNIALGVAFGLVVVFGALGMARAEGGKSIDGASLDALFDVVFHRPADASGREFHLRHDLKTVLEDFRRSPEQKYYGALFKAVKSYEVAQRAPGTLTAQEKQSHLDLIDAALSSVVAWVDTLPDQDPCLGVITPEDARDAIVKAHDGLSTPARSAAEHSIFDNQGPGRSPHDIPVFHKCMRPTPSPVICTADAMLCPDGTSVGRSGPRCEFECPVPTQ